MSFPTGNEKRYGLIIPGKKSKEVQKIPTKSAFADDSEDEEDAKFKQPNFDVKLETMKANLRKKTKINIEKALEEDSSIFLYDEVYDEITNVKNKQVTEICLPSVRKPKYVEKLLKASAVRKLEHELLSERKAQRDLEAEREKFADKESFVTGAYKEKMSEIRQLVERRKEEEAHEEIMDVTKQDGLGGFYRYMYQQRTSSENPSGSGKSTENEECSNTEASINSNATIPKSSQIQNASNFEKKSSHLSNQSPARDMHAVQSSSISENSRSEIPTCSSETSKLVQESSDISQKDSRYFEKRRSHHHSSHRRSRSRSFEESANPKTHHRDRDHEDHRKKHRMEHSLRSATDAPISPHRSKTPPGFIRAKPRFTTDEELAALRSRFLSRKEAGIHADIVLSDDEI